MAQGPGQGAAASQLLAQGLVLEVPKQGSYCEGRGQTRVLTGKWKEVSHGCGSGTAQGTFGLFGQ